MRTSKRIEEISSKGIPWYFLFFLLSVTVLSCMLHSFLDEANVDCHYWIIVSSVQKRQELAEQVNDLSKNFEVKCWYWFLSL